VGVALKPSASTGPAGSRGLGAYQSAIDRAHRTVAASGATSAMPGGALAATPTAPNRDRRAGTIVGFADRFEISQRVADALALK